jgi:hypothetical protein
MRTKVLLAAVLVVMVVGLTGCWSSSPVVHTPASSNHAKVTLVVDSGTDHTIIDQMSRDNPWNAGSPDSLKIDAGKFLVRSIQFVDLSDYEVDTDISAADETQDEQNAWIPFKGPYVVAVTGSESNCLGVRDVEVGNRNALSLVLHKGKSTDDLGTDTEMIGRSVLVTGKVWYGDRVDAFVFSIDLRTELIVPGNFTIPSSGDAEYVVKFSVGKWFRFGDHWLDPNKVENLAHIYRNIQRQIGGGRDYDLDGEVG